MTHIARRGFVLALTLVAFAHIARAQQSIDEALAAARDAARRGDVEQAAARYADVVARDSSSLVVLREAMTLLEQHGRWAQALPYARRIARVALADAPAEFRIGEWSSWGGAADSAAAHLRRAVRLAPDSVRWAAVLGRVLTWKVATRDEGIAVLRRVVARAPADVDSRRALAAVLSWSRDTRPEAQRRFAALVRETPDDVSLLKDYADMLSWNGSTRDDAERVLERASTLAPTDAHIPRSRLNVLVWSGHARRAYTLSDSLLHATPGDTAVLRIHAQLLAALGRPREAVSILRALMSVNASDPSLREQYAYALLGSGDTHGARAMARSLPPSKTPNATDWVRRGTSPAVGVDFLATHTSLGLSLTRFAATASSLVAGRARLSITATPSWLDAPTGDYREQALSGTFEGPTLGLANLRGEAGIEQYTGAGSTWSGALEGVKGLAREGTFRVRLSRAAVEDSRRSARGIDENGRLVGQVRANLLTVSAHIRTVPAGLTLDLLGDAGPYTARGLRTNFRRELQASLFHDYLIGRANFEAGLGASFLSFAYDANRGGAAPSDERGAYWSPTNYGNTFARGSAFYQITGRISARLDGALGYQVTGRSPGATPWNVTAGGESRWTARHGWDVTAGGLYLDNRAGFRMRQLRGGIRHAF